MPDNPAEIQKQTLLAAASGMEDKAITEAVGTLLGADLPEACVGGVASNMRLLARHWAVLREAGHDA